MWRARASSVPHQCPSEEEDDDRKVWSNWMDSGLQIANIDHRCDALRWPSSSKAFRWNPGSDNCPPQFQLNHCAISGLSIHHKGMCRKSPMGIHLTLSLRSSSSPFGAELTWRWDCVIVVPRCPRCNTNIKPCGRECVIWLYATLCRNH